LWLETTFVAVAVVGRTLEEVRGEQEREREREMGRDSSTNVFDE
jgi:hypothetical protein